jgi:DNA gyrase subunit A
MDIVEADATQQVLTVSANGYGKRTPVGEWRLQTRAGKGIIAMDTSERNGELVCLRLVLPEEGLMVITDGGLVIRTRVAEIRETGRNTQGVRVIRLKDGERVVDVEPVTGEDEEEAGEAGVTESGEMAAGDDSLVPGLGQRRTTAVRMRAGAATLGSLATSSR